MIWMLSGEQAFPALTCLYVGYLGASYPSHYSVFLKLYMSVLLLKSSNGLLEAECT